VQPEAKYAGDVDLFGLFRLQLGEDEKEEVGEGGAKVCAVDIIMPGRFALIDVLALCAVQLNGLFAFLIRHSDGEQGLVVTEHTGAGAEVVVTEFVHHRVKTSVGKDISGVYQPIEDLGIMLYHL